MGVSGLVMKRTKKAAEDGAQEIRLIDLQQVFERVCVEEGAAYRNRYGWNHVETDDTVGAMIATFKDTLEEFADYVENGDVEGLTALANRERTRRLMRATNAGLIRPTIDTSTPRSHGR